MEAWGGPPMDYHPLTSDDLTVEDERSLFCEWCDYLGDLRDSYQITQSEFYAARWDLESWYSWIAHQREAAYMEQERIVQLTLFSEEA